jgi:Fe-S-cluster containining protein
MATDKKTPWYAGGLYFECVQCGNCCAGPAAGYIWVTRPEIKLIADFLRITAKELRKKYIRRVGLRTTIIEHNETRDCIFLQQTGGGKKCIIYPVRPAQCRTWPFWTDNLKDPAAWGKTSRKCPGINRGRLYCLDEIQEIRGGAKWWRRDKQRQIVKEVSEIYKWLDLQISEHSNLAGVCAICGKCCELDKFGHKLFITAPEMIYITEKLGRGIPKKMTGGNCPWQQDKRCTIYEHRFAACRIFCCKGDPAFQTTLSESALKKFKAICEDFDIPYRYAELAAAMNDLITCQRADESNSAGLAD